MVSLVEFRMLPNFVIEISSGTDDPSDFLLEESGNGWIHVINGGLHYEKGGFTTYYLQRFISPK